MKKWVKIVLVAGFVLILAGSGVTAAAFAMGADPVRIGNYFERRFDLLDYYEEIRPEDNWVTFEGYERQIHETVVVDRNWIEESIEESVEAAAERTVEFDDTGMELIGSYKQVNRLEIDNRGGDVEVLASDTDTELIVLAYRKNDDSVTYRVSERDKELDIDVRANEVFRIIVPNDWIFDAIEVETTGGSMTLEVPGGFDKKRYDYSLRCENGAIFLPDGTLLEGRESKSSYGAETDSFLTIEAEAGGVIAVTK